jgi:hypothetical protein
MTDDFVNGVVPTNIFTQEEEFTTRAEETSGM